LNGTGLRGVAKEQAALRRVATLVARGAEPEEVFAAVTAEVARLFPTDWTVMCRYVPDGAFTIVGSVGSLGRPWPVGGRWPLGGNNAATLVFETARPARLENYAGVSGAHIDQAREDGIRSTVGTPIIVEGRVWGLMAVVTTREKPLPADTEARLGSFTELVATAVANAESRAELARLAEQQAALRRVATLVARGPSPEEVFLAVTDEIGRLLAADMSHMVRYESDGTFTVLARAGARAHFPVGSRWPLGEKNTLTAIILETGRPGRVNNYADFNGPLADEVRAGGVRSSVAAPIIVEGRVWGLIGISSIREEPPPADTEARLASFTELVATAIANAESRARLARLAGEQEALRRVATLVARGVPPEGVFASVSEEVARLFLTDGAHLSRFDSDGMYTVLASGGKPLLPIGSRWPIGGKNPTTTIFETGRPARIDNYDTTATGELADHIREVGVRSAVATPVIVEGHVWGVVGVGSNRDALAPDTEERLAAFTELVATAIANADSRNQLTASRARLVTEAHEARRRVVRDLHDGAQQGLVHTIIALKLARRALDQGQPDLAPLMSEALQYAETANDDLRELVHGILPSVLTREGLRAGVDELAARMSIPVQIDIGVPRLPPVIEATAYFVAAEALTNVVKHARAERAKVSAFVKDTTLFVEVRDDGVGGADPRGPGMAGLSDRVTALNGRLTVESPSQGGTILAATLPLDSK